MLDYQSIVPLYEQIMETLKDDIQSGKFVSQKKLPTEEELSAVYSVSRITIRRAVAELVKQGLVEKKQGKGTFVCAPKMHKTLNRPGMSFTELCAANGVKPGGKILDMGIVSPRDPQMLDWLGLQEGEPAVRLQRLRYANERPLVIEENFFPMEYAYLLGVNLENESLYRYLREKKGVQIVAGELSLRLVRVDAKAAKLLEVSRGTPMLRTDGCTYTADGRILHTCRQIGYGEDFDFIVR